MRNWDMYLKGTISHPVHNQSFPVEWWRHHRLSGIWDITDHFRPPLTGKLLMHRHDFSAPPILPMHEWKQRKKDFKQSTSPGIPQKKCFVLFFSVEYLVINCVSIEVFVCTFWKITFEKLNGNGKIIKKSPQFCKKAFSLAWGGFCFF